MDREDLGLLKRFIDTALKRGWYPCTQPIEGTFVVLDPACVRIAVTSPSQYIDNDVFVDWLAPLHDVPLAKAVWGEKLVGDSIEYLPAWRYRQHRLLDLLQTAGVKAYFEYLEVTQ